MDIQNKLKEVQTQLFNTTHETDLCEKELKAQRNYKIHYRIQLKDLYYKALKDELSLVYNCVLELSFIKKIGILIIR